VHPVCHLVRELDRDLLDAQVARALTAVLPASGWQVSLASGSLGAPGEPTHAASFYANEVAAVDYTPALALADPLAAAVPFQSLPPREGVPVR
jgi:hypothetical protein